MPLTRVRSRCNLPRKRGPTLVRMAYALPSENERCKPNPARLALGVNVTPHIIVSVLPNHVMLAARGAVLTCLPSSGHALANLSSSGASPSVGDTLMMVECVFIFLFVSAPCHSHGCAQRARCGVERKPGPALPSGAMDTKGRGSHAGRWTTTEF